MTIRGLLERVVSKRPESIAFKWYSSGVWQTRTYAGFLDRVNKISAIYFREFQLKAREENVAVILPNSPDWMEIYLAQSGSGVSVVPIDPKLHTEEIQYILSDSGAVVVTTDKAHVDVMKNIIPTLKSLRAVVVLDGGEADEFTSDGVRFIPYVKLTASDAAGAQPPLKAEDDDIASVIYTSGTTGKPKGAMISHSAFVADAEGALGAMDVHLSYRDSFFVVLPLFHAFSFCTNFVVPMLDGSMMGFTRSLYSISEDIKEIKPSLFMSVPLLAEKIYDRITDKIAASKIARVLIKTGLGFIVRKNILKGLGGNIRFVIVGGAPCPKHVLAGFKKLGVPIFEGYGLTECAPVVSIAGPKCARIGTIGHKLTNIEVRLGDIDSSGVGELQIRGPIVMKGYFHNDEATKDAFDGEWLRTGDLASIDSNGLITICGRKKALIVNREGKNIYPEEIEERISRDPRIKDIVVVGYKVGADVGERVGAIAHPDLEYFKANAGGELPSWDVIEKETKKAIQEICSHIADYKRVRKIKISKEELARTSIMKVRRVVYQGALDEK